MAEVKANESNITLTPAALATLVKMRDERDMQDFDLRIFVKGISCSGYQYGMGFDNEPQEEDTIIEFDGLRLRIDPVSLTYMTGVKVDYVDGPNGAGFSVYNPNDSSSCGSCSTGSCGSDGASAESECGCGDGGCCGG